MRKHYVVQLDRGKPKSRCRTWQLRVDSGTKTKSGGTSWLTRKVTGVTWSQAADECERWAADLDERRAVATRDKSTFGEYRASWIGLCKAEGAAAPGTIHARATNLAAAGYHLDAMRLQDIGPGDINRAVAALRRGESPSGRPLSGTYLRRVVSTVRLLFDHARRAGLVAENPVEGAVVPRDDTPEKRPVGMAELARVEDAMDPCDWHARAVLLLAETGMRQCEVMPPNPMLWGAWDEEGGYLRVSDSKNSNGLRLVPVNGTLRGVLSVAKLHVQLCLDVSDVSAYPILCDDAGEARSYMALYNWWCARRASFGLAGVGLHSLRHAMVSDLLANGATLREVQDIIGDKTGSVVLGVYAHSTLEQRAEAMRALDERRRVQSLYKNAGA